MYLTYNNINITGYSYRLKAGSNLCVSRGTDYLRREKLWTGHSLKIILTAGLDRAHCSTRLPLPFPTSQERVGRDDSELSEKRERERERERPEDSDEIYIVE
ncbi:hypothetical protein Btru_050402 [Bulinus truncatus]|nr:hypothetical protein Btru_050402 [Bulinus truncatus]